MTSLKSIVAKVNGWLWSMFYLKTVLPDPEKVGEEDEVKKFEEHKLELQGDDLKALIDHLHRLTASEDEREKQVESKAFSLIGFTGLVATLIAGFSQLSRSNNLSADVFPVLFGCLYLPMSIALLMTGLGAIKAVRVGKYNFMSPAIEDLFRLKKSRWNEVHRGYANDLIKSFVYNRHLINIKARYVSIAQNWFSYTLVLLILLLMMFGVQFLLSPYMPTTTPTSTPAITSTLNPTPQPPAISPTAVYTSTMRSVPSATPIASSTPHP